MLDFLGELKRRYHTICAAPDIDTDRQRELSASLLSLSLAHARLKRQHLLKSGSVPLQIAVVGPTQAGKSTVVNILLGREVSSVSALAGHTVHCYGYASGLEQSAQVPPDWLTQYFSDMQCRPAVQLDRGISSEYAFESHPERALHEASVIWDTPDFDSLASGRYLDSVVLAMGLADVLVFVVSRDKYADRSVWQMLELVDRLDICSLVLINKTESSTHEELAASFKSKAARLSRGAELPVYFLPDCTDIEALSTAAEWTEIRQRLADYSLQQRENWRAVWLSNARHYWTSWIAEPNREIELLARWRQLVDSTQADLLDAYKEQYLDNSRRDETLQMALAELLVLLEIPGVARPLNKLRGYVTWPMKRLLGVAGIGKPESGAGDKPDSSRERVLLMQLFDHGRAGLIAGLSGADGQHWPDRRFADLLQQRLAHSAEQLKREYNHSVDQYQLDLKQKIDEAARTLYHKLQDQPATLNSLRAARVSADAAAVVLAVKSGGLGLADLVLAPAMLSVTSMLTEGALGQYMQSVQADLLAHQQASVAELLQERFHQPCLDLCKVTTHADMFGLEEAEIVAAKQRLDSGNV